MVLLVETDHLFVETDLLLPCLLFRNNVLSIVEGLRNNNTRSRSKESGGGGDGRGLPAQSSFSGGNYGGMAASGNRSHSIILPNEMLGGGAPAGGGRAQRGSLVYGGEAGMMQGAGRFR